MDERIWVFTTDYCPYCQQAKALLLRKQLAFHEVDVTHDPAKREWLVAATGRRTVPQIFVDGESIGGFDDLAALERRGELDARLRQPPRSGAEPSAEPSRRA